MAGDWVKLHRAARDHEVFQDEWLWKLFCWCLIKANFRESIFRGQKIPPGSFVTGRNAAADELHVSPSKFYRGIERLTSLGCITTSANSGWTTLSVCNWSAYQSGDDSQRTASGQPVIQRADTSEEWKNGRIKETTTTPLPPHGGGGGVIVFDGNLKSVSEVISWFRSQRAALGADDSEATLLGVMACAMHSTSGKNPPGLFLHKVKIGAATGIWPKLSEHQKTYCLQTLNSFLARSNGHA